MCRRCVALALAVVTAVLLLPAAARAEDGERIVGRLWLRPPFAGVTAGHPWNGGNITTDFLALTAGVESSMFVAETGGGATLGGGGWGPQFWIRSGLIPGLEPESRWQFPLLLGYRFTSRVTKSNGSTIEENLGSLALDFGPQVTFGTGSGSGVRGAMRLLLGIALPFAGDTLHLPHHTTSLFSAVLEIGLATPMG